MLTAPSKLKCSFYAECSAKAALQSLLNLVEIDQRSKLVLLIWLIVKMFSIFLVVDFQIAENAILSLMRSWTGILQLAQPRPYGGSHLQALVDILYLHNHEVRVSFKMCIRLKSIYIRIRSDGH